MIEIKIKDKILFSFEIYNLFCKTRWFLIMFEVIQSNMLNVEIVVKTFICQATRVFGIQFKLVIYFFHVSRTHAFSRCVQIIACLFRNLWMWFMHGTNLVLKKFTLFWIVFAYWYRVFSKHCLLALWPQRV